MKRTQAIRHLMVAMVLGVAAMVATAYAQMPDGGARVGVFGGWNYNYVDNGIEQFIIMPGDPGFALADLRKSDGNGFLAGVWVDYAFNDVFGVTLRSGYEDRSISAESGDRRFNATLGYLDVEPGISVAIGMPELHFMAGGSMAIRLVNTYDYNAGQPDGLQPINNADLNNARQTVFGFWGGFAYDLKVADNLGGVSWWITPFAEGSYTLDGMKDDVGETNQWNTLTARAGARISIGF
jgi:hypothetical protein